MQENFEFLRFERQQHPTLSPRMPFELVWEKSGASDAWRGDVHYALQLAVVICGGAEVAYNDFTRHCVPGDLWWTMIWEPHAYRLTGRHNFVLSVNLDADTVGDCGPFPETDYLLPFTQEPCQRYSPRSDAERSEIIAIGRKLFKMNSERADNWRSRCWLEIHRLILMASPASGGASAENTAPGGEFVRVRKAVSLVRSRIGRSPSLDEAARSCALSPSRFSTVFKRCMGVSYGQFALHARLAGAARDVASGEYTLDAVAEKWGFCDASSFCNSFKKIYRCRPGEFRVRRK